MPKVSVLLPVYNTPETYLRECIEGILGQTFGDFELIIVNDASSDANVERVVKSYDDARIRYYANEKNLGISETRNKLLDLARGEYLAIHDHDDISLPERFAKQVEYLDDHPETGVCGTWCEYIPESQIVEFPETDKDIKKEMMKACAVAHSAAMIKKAVLTAHNLRYEAEYSPSEDYCLWLRLIEFTQFYNLPEILFQYRLHKNNTSKKQDGMMCDATQRLQRWAMTKYPVLYTLSTARKTLTTRVKLFKFLPFLKISKTEEKTEVQLFNIIPLMTVAVKEKKRERQVVK